MRHVKTLHFLLTLIAFGLGSSNAADRTVEGYLSPGAFNVIGILPPAPTDGSPQYAADRGMFKAAQGLIGSPRWAMAISDVDYTTPALLKDFSCSVGVELTPENTPHLVKLVERAGADTALQSNNAKIYFKRLRPFQIDDGKTCQPKSDVANSYDYPSGHATLGWTWAIILTELAPDRATAILARGRAYGESRVVCGVHNMSAVWAGWLSASATLSVIRATPDFRTDFEAARNELVALRHSGQLPDPHICAVEAKLVGEDIFIPQ